jgi:hypothetical protein
MFHSSKEHKSSINMTLPHIFQSSREKNTCGEYSVIIRKLNIAMQRNLHIGQQNFYFEP